MDIRWMVVMALFWIVSATSAQPPGTPPPKELLDQSEELDLEGLPQRVFMFLSESGQPVMMPGMSWERLEQLMDLEAGMDAARQPYTYQSLEIIGATDEERAELKIDLRMTIEPTEGRWVSIPLRMKNFHRLAPPDISGVDDYNMTLAPDGSGYLLRVLSDQRNDITMRMGVSARVESSSAAQQLEFRLPNVPTKVSLVTDAEDVMGEVVGRGDEVPAPPEAVPGGRTKFAIESSGGTFSLRWGKFARAAENLPLFEVDSRIMMQWDSPEDAPIVSVRMGIRNVRGSIDSFPLRLPKQARVLDDPPRIGASGPPIKWGKTTTDSEGEIREVIIPEEERLERLELNFDMQLANDTATSSSPLRFRIPSVVGALAQRGEIEISTGGDYRLRWRTVPWIDSELGESRDDSSGRLYRFRFDRASSELPLWLGEKERQLRVVSNSTLTLEKSIARLEMEIQINGQISDGRLQFDDASWRLMEDIETGEALEPIFTEEGSVVEFNATGREDTRPIRIRAEYPIISEDGPVQIALPRVVEAQEMALVQSASVDIVNRGRTMLVVDLEASEGLSRQVSAIGDSKNGGHTDSFRIISQDSPAVIVGAIVDQLPRITLASDSTIEVNGQQLRTTVDWVLSSGLDLEGRLPVRIPPIVLPTAAALSGPVLTTDSLGVNSVDDPAELRFDGQPSQQVTKWNVTVNDQTARLEPIGDRFQLISPSLASGTMSIRWTYDQDLPSVTDGSFQTVSLPRPDIADVTIQGAIMKVSLRGNQQVDLVAADSPMTNELQFDRLPRDPIRLKLQSKLTQRDELTIREIVLRTAVGQSVRNEQVIAKIHGGDEFRVGLPSTAREVSVEAYIDNQSRPVRREGNMLTLNLPGDQSTHVVDLRVWIATSTSSSLAFVQPTLKLPVDAGRVFWQIVTPLDGHVVWASPTLGRSMSWRFDDWQLYRDSTHTDRDLTMMAGSAPNPLPPGNRYLYVGSDLRSFRVTVVSRLVLWMAIGSFVLLTSLMLTHFPRTRHPLTVVIGAVLFAGLLATAPDAAVLAGQFAIIGLVLVIVMIAIRALITPTRTDRVFDNSPIATGSAPSTRTLKKRAIAEQPSIPSTQALPPSTPSEVTP
ncbi:MAG: hypothetical protein AB8B91_06565 [Rubripirellula sp.]